ncbi:hypothetical protein BKA64DRAFT_153842 [Cadophora sp. MPI-SDFR-AT-0126]|nr:hypothetical protein BKA64DRAFT_153842 [Leotiomycetes sp. MPI-SDFR-AT-0126]
MNRNDQISMAWHAAALRAQQGVPDPVVPAVSRSDLCARCTSIDLLAVLHQHVTDDKGNFVIRLESRNELQASACSLCRLFGSVAPSDLPQPFRTPKKCHLRAFSATKVQRTDRGSSIHGIGRLDTTLLGVVHGDGKVPFPNRTQRHLEESGYLCPLQNETLVPRFGVGILAEEIDEDFVKRCLSHCQDDHHLDKACIVNSG